LRLTLVFIGFRCLLTILLSNSLSRSLPPILLPGNANEGSVGVE
jgi:hypothetical protein